MKKHDEGYALLLVIVVILVLSIVAGGIMSLGLNNLKKQRASLNRMTEKYEAQGQIEMIAAKLEQKAVISREAGELTEDKLKAWVREQSGVDPANWEWKETDKTYSCTIALTTQSGSVEITCELQLSGKCDDSAPEEIRIESGKIIYSTYRIGTLEEGGGGQ